MRQRDLITLFAYSEWATDRILEQATKLTDEQFTTAPSANLPSIQAILTHMMNAERLWRARMQSQELPAMLEPAQFPNAAAVQQRLPAERAALHELLNSYDDDTLNESFTFTRRDQQGSAQRWQIFFQLANHAMQHRAEIATILTDYGYSPGDLDFILYIFQQQRAAANN